MSSDADSLSTYREKRDFERTPEPAGDGARAGEAPIFVVQMHDARRLHYDVRLEVDGVLKSWAVPKGPSMDPGDKRLAVMTEDHPLDYAGFEGVIPAAEYGGGTVLLWDRGTYRNLKEEADGEFPAKTVAEALEDGEVTVELAGEKLQGGFVFIHSRMGGREENWLLIKMKDACAAAGAEQITKTHPASVLSGRTIEDIAE